MSKWQRIHLVLEEKMLGPYINHQIRAATLVYDSPPESMISVDVDAKIYDDLSEGMDLIGVLRNSLYILEMFVDYP